MSDEQEKIDQPTPSEANELEEIKKLCDNHEHNWKRALADYQNLKREVAKERDEMGSYATLRVVERFLPAMDYFKMAMEHVPADVRANNAPWLTGVEHISKLFADSMTDLGLKPIKTLGEKFDATKHEAVGEEDAEGKEHGTILKEMQAGYELGGKVVRPAKVITAK